MGNVPLLTREGELRDPEVDRGDNPMRHPIRPAILLAVLSLLVLGAACNGTAPATVGADAAETADTQAEQDTDTLALAWAEPATPLRSRVSLDGTWVFTPSGYSARPVPVPCFWEAIPQEHYDLACPGYLDGTPDEGLTMTESNNWARRTVHQGTYTREIDLPDPAAVTRVSFEALHHQAAVFLNDHEVGTHVGAYQRATFDLTGAVVAGTNTLRVELTDGTALLGPDGHPEWPAGSYAHTDITGIYRPVTLEQLPAVFVDDSFVVPSVRRHDLTVEHTLTNATSEARQVWVLDRAVDADGVTALETPPTPVTVPAHGTARVVVVQAWPAPRLWSPAAPHLYTLRTLVLDDGGDPVDLAEQRFGFREVGIDGGDYVLNGQRMNLLGDSIDDQASRPRYWGPRYLACDQARDTLLRVKALNINVVRFHQAPPEDCVLDVADQLGLLVISESPIFARLDILPPGSNDPTYVEHARAWLDAWVKRQRNHPSIVLWSLENEMWLYFCDLTKEQVFSLREPAQAADSILRPDGLPTTPRPVNWDGDSAFLYHAGFAVETLNWHYPHGDWGTIAPAKEFYEDALANFTPYLVTDVPCGVGETMGHRPHELPAGRSYDQIKAMQGQAVRAMRILGYDDIRPYKLNWAWHTFYADGSEHPFAPYYHSLTTQDEKDRLTRNLAEAYHPIAVFDREYARVTAGLDGSLGPVSLPAGAQVQRTLVVLNDSFLPDRPQAVAWSVIDAETAEVLAGDTFTTTVPLGGREERTIAFQTPDVAAAQLSRRLVLRVESSMGGLEAQTYVAEYAFVIGTAEGPP